jgi:rod shape-determining protein MreD
LAVTIFLHAVLLVTVYVLQSMIFPYLRLFGLVPLLLPIVSTGAAVYQGRVGGGTTGLFAGILCDISLNEPIGVFTIVLTATGIIIGALTDTVLVRGFVTYFLSCAAVLAFVAFVQLFPLLFFEEGIATAPLFMTLLRQTGYSLVFSLPIWFFARARGRRSASGAEKKG